MHIHKNGDSTEMLALACAATLILTQAGDSEPSYKYLHKYSITSMYITYQVSGISTGVA